MGMGIKATVILRDGDKICGISTVMGTIPTFFCSSCCKSACGNNTFHKIVLVRRMACFEMWIICVYVH